MFERCQRHAIFTQTSLSANNVKQIEDKIVNLGKI